MFDISNTNSFNSDVLVPGTDYDYVTRTSINQGILCQTGFVNFENINPAGTWSLGLLQMDFFYRRKPWYAGQFVRKIIPKIKLNENSILFISSLLNRLKPILLSVLVRNVDETFLNSNIILPTKNGKIDFDFMDSFIAELEALRIAELEAYLSVTGLKDYHLTEDEENALSIYKKQHYKTFPVPAIFEVKNTHNILSKDIVENSGNTPYLCASADNNGVSSYIAYNKEFLDKGNCIFIGGKTFVVSYQEKDFYSNDSHNLSLSLWKSEKKQREVQLYLATCIKKSLGHKYTWGDSISKAKIRKDNVALPIDSNGEPNYDMMPTFIRAIQKLVIRDVVEYADTKISTTKQVVQPFEKSTHHRKDFYLDPNKSIYGDKAAETDED